MSFSLSLSKYFVKTRNERFYGGHFQESLERPISKKYKGYIWSKDFSKVVHKIRMQAVLKRFSEDHHGLHIY